MVAIGIVEGLEMIHIIYNKTQLAARIRENILYLLPLFFKGQPVKELSENSQIIGYLSTRSEIFPTLFKNRSFEYLDVNSITINPSHKHYFSALEIANIFDFDIRKNDYDEKLVNAMNNAIFRMSLIIIFISLLLYPLIAFLVGKPLLAISKHIDF